MVIRLDNVVINYNIDERLNVDREIEIKILEIRQLKKHPLMSHKRTLNINTILSTYSPF